MHLEGDELGAKRRQILLQMCFAAFSLPPIGFVSNALAEIGNTAFDVCFFDFEDFFWLLISNSLHFRFPKRFPILY